MRIDGRRVRRELLLGLCVWGSIGLFFYTRSYVRLALDTTQPAWSLVWWRAAAETGVDVLVWTLYTPVILALSRRFAVRSGVAAAHLAVHVAAALGMASASVLVNYGVATVTHVDEPRLPLFYAYTMYANVLSYAAAVAAAHALDFYRRYRDRELRAAQLETQLARSRLHALEMQLHPHFLYNTLNSISELIHHDPAGAEAMVAQLGDLLRMTTDGAGATEVPLRRELEFAEAYLQIERTRFGERLRVRTRVAPEAMDALVPNLLLQPLVENAVRHGLSPRAAPGVLSITAEVRGATLVLTITDDGVGLPPAAARRERVGIGNTRTRLAQAYGAAHRFALEDAPGGGTRAVIEIPYLRAEADAGPPPPVPTLAGAAG